MEISMKWNNTTDHAIRTLVYLANERKVTPSAELAHFLNLSQPAVINNVGPLLDAGYVGVVSGMNGGYFLGKDPHKITVYDAIITMESPDLFPFSEQKTAATKMVDDVFQLVQWSCDNIFKSITIADLSNIHDTSITKLKKKAFNEVIAGLADMPAVDMQPNGEMKGA